MEVITIGDMIEDGVQFTLDRTPTSYEWNGKPISGYGIHKITVSDTGVGTDEELVQVKHWAADALGEFDKIEKILKAGGFKAN